jgi:hypothetical protein
LSLCESADVIDGYRFTAAAQSLKTSIRSELLTHDLCSPLPLDMIG